MAISIMRQLLVLLPAAFILARIGGLNAVWWSFPIAEIFSAAMCVVIMRKLVKEQIDPLYKKGTLNGVS